MINLRESVKSEIPRFVTMEQSSGTSEFIIPYSAEKHLIEMQRDNTIYLSIFYENKLSGLMILTKEGQSVEFKRIVVEQKGCGIGQKAIKAMETYCMTVLSANRIWLDVFKSNLRGQHIYQKLGYNPFKSEQYGDKTLLYMEKSLNNIPSANQ
jgi:ribosomal protein S18 acetylase RimI-like enzyme